MKAELGWHGWEASPAGTREKCVECNTAWSFDELNPEFSMPPKRTAKHKLRRADVKEAEAVNSAPKPAFALLDLPDAVTYQVVRFSKGPQGRHPLLAVCQGCRDTVIEAAQEISFSLPHASDFHPASIRFLDRACQQALPGLALSLDVRHDSSALLKLLEPGIRKSWTIVHNLQVTTWHTPGLMYLGLAFPELRSLHVITPYIHGLSHAPDGGLFCGIQGCCNLRSLRLEDLRVTNDAVPPAAAALARLPCLKEVHLQSSTPLGLPAQLTGLTQLLLYGYDQPWVSAVKNLAKLQSLTVVPRNFTAEYPEAYSGLEASVLEQLLTACTSITSLDIRTYTLDQQGLDVLLAHGSTITTLKVPAIQATQDRTHAKWHVSKLILVDGHVHQVAHLPLKSVQELQLGRVPGSLQLQLYGDTISAVLPLLQTAATNMAACPAWQSGQHSGIELSGGDHSEIQGSIDSPHLIQLFSALAPLAAPHIKAFKLHLQGNVGSLLILGRAEVEALGRSPGQHLETLVLDWASATKTFWPALSAALPQLSSLQFGGDADGAAPCTSQDLTVYCCSRPASRPLAVCIPQYCYNTWDCAELMGSIRAQGLTHITISAWDA